MIEGLCVLFPDSKMRTTEFVFLYTGDVKEHAHTCQLVLRRGTVLSTTFEQPITLRENDVFLSDGSFEISQSTNDVKHEFMGIPKLRNVQKNLKTKEGIRQGTGPSSQVNARLLLHDGCFFELSKTDEEYVIYKKPKGNGIGKPLRITRCLVYERWIESDTASIRIAGASRYGETLEFGPVGDYAEIVMGNYSHEETYLSKEGEGESAHFGHVFAIFVDPPEDEYGLKTVKRAKSKKPGSKRDRSIHVPCVGGCVC